MKTNIVTQSAFFILFSFLFSSCAAVSAVFNAGMGFGIFAVLGVLVVIVYIFMRVMKK